MKTFDIWVSGSPTDTVQVEAETATDAAIKGWEIFRQETPHLRYALIRVAHTRIPPPKPVITPLVPRTNVHDPFFDDYVETEEGSLYGAAAELKDSVYELLDAYAELVAEHGRNTRSIIQRIKTLLEEKGVLTARASTN